MPPRHRQRPPTIPSSTTSTNAAARPSKSPGATPRHSRRAAPSRQQRRHAPCRRWPPGDVGVYGLHSAAEIPAGTGRLVLVPMGNRHDPDSEFGIEKNQNSLAWHPIAADPSGDLLERTSASPAARRCSVRGVAGIDTAVAVSLVDAALAHGKIRASSGWARNRPQCPRPDRAP